MQITLDLVALALYDVVLYCDDSGSMAFEENVRIHPSLSNLPHLKGQLPSSPTQHSRPNPSSIFVTVTLHHCDLAHTKRQRPRAS